MLHDEFDNQLYYVKDGYLVLRNRVGASLNYGRADAGNRCLAIQEKMCQLYMDVCFLDFGGFYCVFFVVCC